MIIAPLWCFGLLAVFVAGCLLAFGLTYLFERFNNYRMDRELRYWKRWEEDENGSLAGSIVIAGGIIAVAAVGGLWYFHPERGTTFWIALIGLGIVFCVIAPILIYLAFYDQPKKIKKPPSQQYSHQSRRWTDGPASQTGPSPPCTETNRPPTQAQPDRSAKPVSITPAPEDPYRGLLAKVKYDQNQADKLIEDEQKRMPGANLDAICRSILHRENL